MPRWKPDARERLVVAAIQLFSDQGYDATTVAEIAETAGLTRSTFFRHFPDKRDVLAAGQESLSSLLRQGIDDAPAGASAMTAVESGLLSAARMMTPDHREFGPQLRAVVAASAELRERDQLKHVGLAAAAAEALEARGIEPRTAALAAEVGLLAFKNAYETWTDDTDSTDSGRARTPAGSATQGELDDDTEGEDDTEGDSAEVPNGTMAFAAVLTEELAALRTRMSLLG